ncbi:hypothetical protein OG196_32275 [Kitasatospora purpeofusca]|uniref:hypothetical protein n=1 Tax=Kitasatospora purpeofusca TaxID=67352 RepID=UPI002E120DC1|nr:hypothetical protein OG196_32275 [Kitasatospora purpeofusca]
MANFGDPPRFDIRMVPLLGMERPSSRSVIVADSKILREAVDVIGQQFQRETTSDIAPFSAERGEAEGVLFVSRRFHATFPIAAGAAGFAIEDGVWWMDWIRIHPYERGRGLMDAIWIDLENRYGQFHIDGPYSRAMLAFLRRRNIPTERLNRPLE